MCDNTYYNRDTREDYKINHKMSLSRTGYKTSKASLDSYDDEDTDDTTEFNRNSRRSNAKNKKVVKIRKSQRDKSTKTNSSKSNLRNEKSTVKRKAGSKHSKQSAKSKSRSKSHGFNSHAVESLLTSQVLSISKSRSASKSSKSDTASLSKSDSASNKASKRNKKSTASADDSETAATHSDISAESSGERSEDSSGSKKKGKVALPIEEAIKTPTERSRFVKLKRFYQRRCSAKDIQLMVDIINKNHPISLRNINWFSSKYLARMDSRYYTNEDGEKKLFNPIMPYNIHLTRYKKEGFDPFRRGPAFNWNYDPKDKSKTVITTLCQLQFFKFLFEYELIDYIVENLTELKSIMRKYEKRKKELKKKEKEDKLKSETQDKKKKTNTKTTKKSKSKSSAKSKKKKKVKVHAKRRDEKHQAKLIIKIG